MFSNYFTGKDLGHAFDIPRQLQESVFFAHVCLKSCDVHVNFGAQPFKFTPVRLFFSFLSIQIYI